MVGWRLELPSGDLATSSRIRFQSSPTTSCRASGLGHSVALYLDEADIA